HQGFLEFVLSTWKTYVNNPYQFAAWSPYNMAWLYYSMVRLARPRHVVETGVRDGISSMILLRALEDNDYGELHSIDLHDEAVLRIGKKSGWAVPQELRSRWELLIGRSDQIMEPLLKKIGQV